MSYWTNKLVEQNSLINRPCFYKTPLKHNEFSFAQIREINTKVTEKGNQVTAILDNGIVAVLHCYGCPDYIGNKVWGFLTEEECREYWDM